MNERDLSVADRFCLVLAEIRSLKDSYDVADPLRFAKNKAVMAATKVLFDATTSAAEIISCCKAFEQDSKETSND